MENRYLAICIYIRYKKLFSYTTDRIKGKLRKREFISFNEYNTVSLPAFNSCASFLSYVVVLKFNHALANTNRTKKRCSGKTGKPSAAVDARFSAPVDAVVIKIDENYCPNDLTIEFKKI